MGGVIDMAWTLQYPAVLKVKIKLKLKWHPPDLAQNPGFRRKTAVRALPRDPPGEGGQEKNKKHPLIQLEI